MKAAASAHLGKLIAAAGAVSGQKFGLLVATSLIATSGIVASALTGSGGIGPVTTAAVAGLFDQQPTAATTAAPPPAAPEESFSSPSSPQSTSSAGAASPGPLPASTPSPAPEPASPAPETPEAPPPSEPELPEAGPVKHVFLISLASPGYEAAFGTSSQMPYLSGTLRQQGVLLTNYSLLDPASSPNGFATISGQPPTEASKGDCADYEKCLFPVETLTLADQLGTARFTWHAYIEDMTDTAGSPANCVHPEPDATETTTSGAYSATSNPFVYFHSLLDLGDCAANDVAGNQLPKDLAKATKTANFSYLAPSRCNAGFRGQCPEGTADGPAAANAWLEKTAKEVLASAAYKKDGLLIVSFGALDPAAQEAAAASGVDPLKVGALLISPLLTPNGNDGAAYTPYSLLRSSDELFGLTPLAEAGKKKVHSFASAFIAGETAAGD